MTPGSQRQGAHRQGTDPGPSYPKSFSPTPPSPQNPPIHKPSGDSGPSYPKAFSPSPPSTPLNERKHSSRTADTNFSPSPPSTPLHERKTESRTTEPFFSPSDTRTHDWEEDAALRRASTSGSVPRRSSWTYPQSVLQQSHANSYNTQSTLQSNTLTKTSTGHSSASSDIREARAKLGLHPQAPIDEKHDDSAQQLLFWPRVRLVLREPFLEFWGVLIMVLFGNGSVAQVLLSTGQETAPGGNGYGAYSNINWGWGLGVMLGLYVAGDSGAYLNPAITFANCVYRRLPWRRFPMYLLAQFMGGFVGSGIVYANYISAIDYMEGGKMRTVPPAKTATAAIFCTYPQPFVTRASQFFSEFIASAILIFVIYALKDQSNNGVPKDDKWFPLNLFFLVYGIGACFGWETAYAINLARDFGPRLMSWALGYGTEVWSAGGYYFWIPLVAPFCGCMFGGFLYDFFIYTGESPINTPYLGMKFLFKPWTAIKKRNVRDHEEGIV